MGAQDIDRLEAAVRDLSKEVRALAVEVATIRGARRVELGLMAAVGLAVLGVIVNQFLGA